MTSATPGLTPLLRRLWRHLGARRRAQLMAVLALSVISVIAEVVSLGATLPFIAVLAAPERAFSYPGVKHLAASIGIQTPSQLVLPLTLAFAAAAVISGLVRVALTWSSTRFTFATGAELSLEIYRRTLYQPYEVHISRSSSEIITGIASKVGGTMLGTLLPGVLFVSSAMLLVGIMLALLLVDPLAALIAACGFGASYGLITMLTNRALRANSVRIAAEQTHVVKALQEGLGGIRDVLLDGAQPFYCSVYSRADEAFRRAQGVNIFIQQCPRPLLEAFGMVLIATLAYGFSFREGGVAAALPVLAALALGAQRLLPALQQCFASWASIVGNQATLLDTLSLLDQPLPPEALEPPPPALVFEHAVELRNLSFRYAPQAPWVVRELNLTIPRGARIGFVGGTGSGKSTTMDLIMGLLRPEGGEIYVDGEAISGMRVRAWQQIIAHVPQTIYLADASVAENIAFGVPRESIDMERVRSAARQAQIAEFIESSTAGYDGYVGERGVRLSGGQRQRIGIARALYKRASVLVLDEATSALDNLTERSVMDGIEALDRNLTILIIAHRLSTVRRCDTIVQLEQGHVMAQGSYEQLLASSQSFVDMAHAATF